MNNRFLEGLRLDMRRKEYVDAALSKPSKLKKTAATIQPR